MKSMNVKKLVALGVAAAIAAMPVAHAAQTFNTGALPTAKDWYLNSVVVVGHGSAPSDAVWAGNIAAAIANMAYTEETKTITADISGAKVKLSVPGETIVGAEGYRDKVAINIQGTETLNKTVFTDTEIPGLKYNAELSYRLKSGDTWEDKTAYVTEKVYLNQFDFEPYKVENSKDVEFRAAVPVGQLYYEVTVTGLPSGGDATYEKDQNYTGLTVDILGKEFIITKIVTNTSGVIKDIELATSASEEQLSVGQEIDLEGGYKLKVVDIEEADTPTNRRALLELTTPDGETITKVVDYGGSTDFDGALDYEVTVKEIFVGTAEKYVVLGLKAEKISATGLDTADYEKTDFMSDMWKLKIPQTTTAGEIKFQVIWDSDDDSTYASIDKGLKVGESIRFPGDTRLGVAFEGLTVEDMVPFKIDGSSVTMIDSDGREITAKLFYSVTSIAGDSKRSISNFVGDKTLYYEIDTATPALKYSLGSDALDQTATMYGDSTNGWVALMDLGNNVKYLVYIKPSGTQYDVYMELFTAGATTPTWDTHKVYEVEPVVKKSNGGWAVVGFTGSMIVNADDQNTVTLGDITIKVSDVDVGGTADGSLDAVNIDIGNDGTIEGSSVSTDGSYFYNADIDGDGNPDVTYMVKITGLGTAGPGTVTIYGPFAFDSGKYGYKLTFGTGYTDDAIYVPIDVDDTYKYKIAGLKLDEDKVAYFEDASTSYEVDYDQSDTTVSEYWITEFGGEIKAEGTSKVDIEVPVSVRKVKVFTGELAETVEQTGIMEAGVGETVKIGDYEVKIEGVEAEGATATYTEVKPIKLDRLVYLDNEVPSGKNLIVVGGYFVNSIAEAIANEHPEIKDAVAAEGDYIVDKYTYNGRDAILVFGYTAEDTAAAAQEFLNWLKSNVQ